VSKKSLTITDVAKAAQLYMKTQEYQDFKKSIRDFNSKLSQSVIIENKADWMAWINVNLSSTSFASVIEFETMYDDFTNKAEILVLANAELFDLMKNSKVDQLQQILEPEFNHDFPVSSSSCQDDCQATCNGQLDILDSAVGRALNDIFRRPYNPGYTDADAYETVMQYYEERWWDIVQQFNNCLSGC
jgi:hypothetical protein